MPALKERKEAATGLQVQLKHKKRLLVWAKTGGDIPSDDALKREIDYDLLKMSAFEDARKRGLTPEALDADLRAKAEWIGEQMASKKEPYAAASEQLSKEQEAYTFARCARLIHATVFPGKQLGDDDYARMLEDAGSEKKFFLQMVGRVYDSRMHRDPASLTTAVLARVDEAWDKTYAASLKPFLERYTDSAWETIGLDRAPATRESTPAAAARVDTTEVPEFLDLRREETTTLNVAGPMVDQVQKLVLNESGLTLTDPGGAIEQVNSRNGDIPSRLREVLLALAKQVTGKKVDSSGTGSGAGGVAKTTSMQRTFRGGVKYSVSGVENVELFLRISQELGVKEQLTRQH